MNGSGQHLLLYDGVCGLCDRVVQTVLARDRDQVFDFASLQSPVSKALLARHRREPDALDTVYVVADYRTATPRLIDKGQAALFVAARIGWPWKAARALGVLPRRLLNAGYDVVARHRYRVFGRFDQCALVRPEHRARFIEVEGDDHVGGRPDASGG